MRSLPTAAPAPARQPPPSAATTPSAQPPTTAGPSSDAAGESMATATAAAVAAGANLTAQQVEYLRVVQENQLLRQYLAQCQALIGQLGQQLHSSSLRRHRQLRCRVPRGRSARWHRSASGAGWLINGI